MLIGILADSHLDSEEVKQKKGDYQHLLKKLKYVFEGVDHIIHAGDICCREFLEDLENIAPVSAVRGNMDEFTNLKSIPKILSLEFEQIRIGVAHKLEDIIYFEDEKINIFVFGHTHIPLVKTNEKDVLLINPGSLTRPKAPPKRYLFSEDTEPRPTIVILNIDEGILSSFIKRI